MCPRYFMHITYIMKILIPPSSFAIKKSFIATSLHKIIVIYIFIP